MDILKINYTHPSLSLLNFCVQNVWGNALPNVFVLPLLKVGLFDPYSDDPRLCVQKISFCKYSGRLVLAGTAGQVKYDLRGFYIS